MRQVPQCCGSLVRSVHTPEQEDCAPGQRHLPVVQTRPPEQLRPQPPQFVSLVWRSTHAPPHDASMPGQLAVHAPAEQTSLTRQVLPQAPQLVASLDVSVHWLAHNVCMPGQTQAPPVQSRPSAHDTPQPPQFVRLVLVSTQAAPQDVRGSLHCEAQVD